MLLLPQFLYNQYYNQNWQYSASVIETMQDEEYIWIRVDGIDQKVYQNYPIHDFNQYVNLNECTISLKYLIQKEIAVIHAIS